MTGKRDFSGKFHAHDCFFLVYVMKGANLEIVEDKTIALSENDLLLLTPYTRHHNLHTASAQVVFFHLDPMALLRILKPAILENVLLSDFFADFMMDKTVRKAVLFRDCAGKARPILQEIIQEYVEEKPLYHSYIDSLVGLLMIELARNHTFQLMDYSNAASEEMTRILQYLTDHYQDVSLEELARKFGYHPAYLSRKIHQFTGKTYRSLLADYRLTQAAILLQERQLSVEDIAASCGFREISSFYKAFSKKYHCAPRQFIS